MSTPNYKLTKFACYFSNVSMASVFCLPPLLFAGFQSIYGISYTLLGTLVLINFCTQLTVDLIFSFFSKHFNMKYTLRIMPLFTALGLAIYALIPTVFPQYAYWGLVVGTVIFSVSAGLSEVLLSPTVAALPSLHPDREMSRLHSLYAYGFVGVVILSALFLQVFGKEYWMVLVLLWAIPPVLSAILLMRAPIPALNTQQATSRARSSRSRTVGLMLCMACIFLGAAAENTMTNWISVYIEKALQLPKLWGDLFGMCAFGLVLGLARTAYAKYGKNIWTVLLLGMIGAAVCYCTVAFCGNGIISVITCVVTGIFVSMLWPGTLILMEENIPAVGVAAYALMAAGGDFGSSVAPQLTGSIVDGVAASAWARELGMTLSLTPEQIGLKIAMLVAALFPLLGIAVLLVLRSHFSKHPKEE